MELLNTNSYQKGAWIIHMLRFETGDESFWADSGSSGRRVISVEQTQKDLFVFDIEIGIRDRNGFRKQAVHVNQRFTEFEADADMDAELLVDPDINLLQRLNAGKER